MSSHPLHKIITGKSLSLHSDSLCENKINLNGDYCMRISMESMTMSDILIYAQHKIDRARHKLNKIEKELSKYDSEDSITKELKRSQKRHEKLKKERPWSFDLCWEYDIDFECKYIALAQERLQQINKYFPDKISTYRLVDSVRNLIKKHNITKKDTSYSLKLDQACKEWLYDLDNKSNIVDLCAVYDILSDIADVSEHFKPYNMSYGTIQIDIGWICFWVCNKDEYDNLSSKKRELLAQQSYLIDSEYLPVESMWYTVYLYLPNYIDRLWQDPRPTMSLEEEQLCQILAHKAIEDFIQQRDLKSISFYCGMLVHKDRYSAK